MKNDILRVYRFFAENQDGKIVILDRSGINNSDMGESNKSMDSLRDNFHREYDEMWNNLRSFVARSERVFIPTGIGESFEVTKETSPRELLRIASERLGARQAYSDGGNSQDIQARNYCSHTMWEILRNAATYDKEFYGDIVRWAVGLGEKLADIDRKETMEIVCKSSDSEVRRLSSRAERIEAAELMSSLKGLDEEGGEVVGTYAEIRDAVVLNRRLGIISRSGAKMKDWAETDNNPQRELKDVCILRHWSDSKGDDAMRAFIEEHIGNYHEHKFKNLKHARSASDADISEIITSISGQGREDSAIARTPLMLLEVYRRGMQDNYYLSAESLVTCLSEMYSAFPAWPSAYAGEIDEMARDISRRATDETMEGIFRLVRRYTRTSSTRSFRDEFNLERAFERFFSPNVARLSKISTLAGKSPEYAELLLLNKMIVDHDGPAARNILDTVYDSERDTKIIRSSTLDSIYLRAFMVVSTMTEDGDEMPEGLLREIYSDAFRMLLSANKAERKNFIRLVSYALHNPRTVASCKGPLELRVRVFMEELSGSKLKDATIEKMLSLPETTHWRRSSNSARKILGMSYVEMATLAGESVRQSLKATLLRMELE
jgi:hypothetical protein